MYGKSEVGMIGWNGGKVLWSCWSIRAPLEPRLKPWRDKIPLWRHNLRRAMMTCLDWISCRG